MTKGLSEGIKLGWKYRQDENRLYLELKRGVVKVAPRPYRRYMRAYYRQPLYPGIETKLLSYWQWRTYAAELAEVVATAATLGRAPGDQEDALRCSLLLAPEEPSKAPYQALLAAGESVDPAPQARDGRIDASLYCYTLVDESDLVGDEYIKAASKLMYWLWPQDYLRYAMRYFARHFTRHRQGPSPTCIPWPRSLEHWRSRVAALAAEMARCHAAGEGQSPLWLELAEWLLLEPQEGVPSPDWEMPLAMAERLAWYETLTLLE
jgi:hypothetical protein